MTRHCVNLCMGHNLVQDYNLWPGPDVTRLNMHPCTLQLIMSAFRGLSCIRPSRPRLCLAPRHTHLPWTVSVLADVTGLANLVSPSPDTTPSRPISLSRRLSGPLDIRRKYNWTPLWMSRRR